MDLAKQNFLTSLLEYPEETTVAEYKSAVTFDSKSDFGAKLVKQILGHANTGGGYIVIGFQEDSNGKLLADAALTKKCLDPHDAEEVASLSPIQNLEP